jgi:glucose-6-phosphate 1-epimerase
VYLNSPSHVELEVGTGAAVALDSSGWEDTVVWNPYTTMKDCYEHFCCVENAKWVKPACGLGGCALRGGATYG